MSFYDSDGAESEPASLRSTVSGDSKRSLGAELELSIPPPPLPPKPSALQALPHGPLYVGDRFPNPEGQQFEFKETWGACTTSKMHETICAFLNSAGGYLMYGIQDSGKILGISRDEADKILLRADDIFHTSKILNTVTGKPPAVSSIRGSVMRLCTQINNRPHPTERFLAILTVINPDHNQTYRMTNGDIIIRLSASNFRSKSTTLSTFEELIRDNRALEAEKTKYYTERNVYRKEFAVMEHSHRELSIRIK
jgi:predicted HTH transcriptional regulator